jgi:hypothetical protein
MYRLERTDQSAVSPQKFGNQKLRKMFNAAQTPPHAKKSVAAENKMVYARLLDQKDGSDCPAQSGIFTPGLMLRSMSMMPHLSSHSLPFSLYRTFHGSSNAENLFHRVSNNNSMGGFFS